MLKSQVCAYFGSGGMIRMPLKMPNTLGNFDTNGCCPIDIPTMFACMKALADLYY